MGKRRSDWEQTAQYRFGRWLRAGWEPLDRRMEEALFEEGEAPRGEQEARRAEQEREARLSARHAEDLLIEEKLHSQLHAWSNTRGRKLLNRLYALLSVLICGAIIWLLLSTVSAMPLFGDPGSPSNNEVARRYVEKGVEETGAVNIVAGVILDYRAFDTLGESSVLFIAACAVLILLRIDPGADGTPGAELIAAEADDRHYEPKNDVILQGSARILTPLVLLFGMYVILNGHLSPGGGFSGGSIMSAGLVLYLNAFGFRRASRFFTYRTFLWTSFSALLFYVLAKAYSFYCGANGIPSGIPLGSPGAILSSGLILPLNVAVGLVVTSTMYAFYTLFRKGSME